MGVNEQLVVAVVLLSVGLGSALSRRNILAVVMGVATAGIGALIALATVDMQSAKDSAGITMGLCLTGVLLAWIVMAGVLAFRRFSTTGNTEVDEGNELRH